MNKEQMWASLVMRDPSMVVKPHSPEAVRRIFDATWNTAYAIGCRDMAERKQEITGGTQEQAASEAADAIIAEIESAMSAIFGGDVPIHKIYATKKASKKKTDSGGK